MPIISEGDLVGCVISVQTPENQNAQPPARDVEIKLYRGLRHEILNEDCRAVVYNDIWNWIEKHL